MAEFEDKNCTAADYTVASESSRTIAWEELALPDDFPKLADGVTAFTDKTDSDDTYNFELEWDYMTLSEMAVIADKLEEYYDCRMDMSIENGSVFVANITNGEKYSVSIRRNQDDFDGIQVDNQVTLSIWVY